MTNIPDDPADAPRDDLQPPEWDERTDLYISGAMSPTYQLLPRLASAWMRELVGVGLRTYGRKEAWDPAYPPGYAAGGGYARRVRLENGQVLELRFKAYTEDPYGDGRQFWRTEVRGVTPRTDRAILAALAVVEGTEVGKEGLDRIRRNLQGERVALKAGEDKLLAFARVLLLWYRPDLDELSDEGVEMLVGVCERAAAVSRAARRLADFLEFGAVGRDTRPGIEDAQLDVYAAELRHFADMSWPEIARRLGLDTDEETKKRSAAITASQKGERGTQLHLRALGEDGWRRFKDIQRRHYRQT
jgi:hypothetical protein